MRRTVADYFDLLKRRARARNWLVARAIAAVRYGDAEAAPDDEVHEVNGRLPSLLSADEARRRIALAGARVDPIHPIAWKEATTRVMVVHKKTRLRALGVLGDLVGVAVADVCYFVGDEERLSDPEAVEVRQRLEAFLGGPE